MFLCTVFRRMNAGLIETPGVEELVCKTNKCQASNTQMDAGRRGRHGDLYTCVHASCDKVTIEVTTAQKRKKSCKISVQLNATESAEKLKETAACEFGIEAKKI